ncbi:hypothetical protein METBIDRAFT_9992 [Metschnikowia bicuspidata var. bicuspidata NRRL YB-4993]|uniref:STAS domain-containing protein n=1 Tax=Metschnikowia bicuspidata var. bicuspidata NRRL YB-4993 TaxID=869754 RepID=A0A1A0HIP9_9ASCO|nr:hypothetical protein METBIDRAFT_9992 [Metschnikowia bicuspidata var. bicuspidata NRRL YB-4993]OBA23762.1 hypothetical protein METBIDRAFT_9992 [Metschnikowia bicuspidata var. bicuspidata NRRL YB-4993]
MSLENTRLLAPATRKPAMRPVVSVPSSRPLKRTSSYIEHHGLEPPDLENQNHRPFDRWAYVAYYVPVLRWAPRYKRGDFLGDVLAGVSLASFQIPLVMSLATSLARLPPLVGLYSVVAAALTYAVLGGVPVLVVGPLPSTAVLYGQVVEGLRHDSAGRFAALSALEISAALSVGMAGVLLAAGLLRCGFLDSVLSRSLLKGFIGAMGVIMISNQLDIQMGLAAEARAHPHGSVVAKWAFAWRHREQAHVKTVCLTVATLVLVLAVRRQKRVWVEVRGRKAAVYIPELLAMVVAATALSYVFDWELQGIQVMGSLASPGPHGAARSVLVNPFTGASLGLLKSAFGTSFLCALLGFFDSTTATKALGARYNYNISSNRELVALGASNLAVALFGGLPSFGALGRSKVNVLAGAATPLASVVMALTVLMAILYFLPLMYYLPECVLSLSTTIIGITVLEEVPHDLAFFWRIRGFGEIAVLLAVFCATVFWNVEVGVVLGVLVAVVRVIRNGTRSQIHILGRVPNTAAFRNADDLIEESFHAWSDDDASDANSATLSEVAAEIQQIEGVLIVRVPEPLNFANVGDLRNRLHRLEKFGTLLVHPSQAPREPSAASGTRLIVFDCKGMSAIDASATQELYEAVRRYKDVSQIHVAFARTPTQQQVRSRLVRLGIRDIVNQSMDEFEASNPYGDSVQTSVSAGLGRGFFLSIDEAIRAFGVKAAF